MDATQYPLGRAVRVLWHDSAFMMGWRKMQGLTPDPVPIISLGYVVCQSNDALSLSTSISEEHDCITPISIPWGCIEKVSELGDNYDRKLPDRS
jgi:hypothetical protein